METRSLFKWLMSPLGHMRLSLKSRARVAPVEPRAASSMPKSVSYNTGYHLGPFPTNEWRTSKYTLISFLPRNLFEQFRRLANFYFLITAVIQILLPFSPVGPFTSLVPLVFVVGVTSIKQAYEDYLRHKSDRELNDRVCHIVSPASKQLTRVRSKDIRVGEIVYVKNNEEIPCDMILLSGSGSASDRCYITTSNLDGETNLKSRNCTCLREQLGTIEHILSSALLLVECELPNATLYEFNGFLRSPKDKRAYDYIVDSSNQQARNPQEPVTWSQSSALQLMGRVQRIVANSQRKQNQANSKQSEPNAGDIIEIPLDISNLLPRASRLRNTSHVFGLVVYTGPDSKLAQNLLVKPNKFSSTESRINIFLLIAFIILIGYTAVSTLSYLPPSAWYLRDLEKEDTWVQIALAHFLLYNYIMPISLYVTLEFVKFFGTISVTEDKQMRVLKPVENNGKQSSEPAGQRPAARSSFEGPKCNSSDLNEELGQIDVLFSDKTGTLTENKMCFMAAAIQGKLYRHKDERLFEQVPTSELLLRPAVNVAREMSRMRRGRHALLPNLLGGGPTGASKGARQLTEAQKARVSPKSKWEPGVRPFDHRLEPEPDKLTPIERLEEHPNVVEFFICLCLCSTITLNESVPLESCIASRDKLDFMAASPDEESFINSANEYGISLCKSTDRECYILIRRTPGAKIQTPKLDDETNKQTPAFRPIVESTKHADGQFYVRHFKKLALLEFNSARKRMSVICEDCDNGCLLLVTKGSEELLDCCDLASMAPAREAQINLTLAMFEAFSRSGLRTLLVARRQIKQAEFQTIESSMKEIRMSIQNRDQMMESFYGKTERGLFLLGATAVEDSLQVGVPETIANLKEAGIKVWLLTGDKVETALSVAHLCRLLDDKQFLFNLVRQQDFKSCQKLLGTFIHKLESSARANNRLESPPPSASRPHQWQQQQQQFALVADGRSLHYAMRHSRPQLSRVCQSCNCVLGCRLSPLQKAEVVKMMKEASDEPVTAAIGDGANDVSMIQEAHVGIGISGKEGRQAVNSSDFAIGRFHLLNRLLFVHGHLFYHRAAHIILYFFYKNLLFMVPQFLYSFYNRASAQSFYAPLMMVGFNLFWTSTPILLYGLTEVHIPDKMLHMFPNLYSINRRNVHMRLGNFFAWLLLGCLQGLIVFYLLLFVWGSHTPLLESGQSSTINGIPIMTFLAVVALANLRLYFMSHHQSLLFHLITLASTATLPASLYVYSLFPWAPTVDNSFYGQVLAYFASPNFWLGVLLALSAALLPEVAWHLYNQVQFHKLVFDYTKQKRAFLKQLSLASKISSSDCDNAGANLNGSRSSGSGSHSALNKTLVNS